MAHQTDEGTARGTAAAGGRGRLAFTGIEIRRAPGITPGFTIRNLSPDINIVYGPNASGKSTTARAIQALIWPHPSVLRGHALAAAFDLDGARWTIDAGPGRVRRTRDGEPADAPVLTPIDDRGRYTLGLPDLLASENQPFAQAILKESTGGFDLDAVAASQRYRGTLPTRLEAARDVEAATLRLRDAERVQNDVAAQQRQLPALRERERRARRAEADAARFRRALDLAHTRFELEAAERTLATFRAGLANANGDEPARLATLAERLTELERRRRELEHALDRATADLAATGIEGADISEATIRGLRTATGELKRLDTEIAGLRRDRETAIAERDAHGRRLAVDLSEEQIQALDTAGLRELARLSNDYATIRVRRQVRDEVERWIGAVEDPGNVEDLRLGIDALNQRLQTPNAAEAGRLLARTRLAAYVGGAGTIAGAIWLAAFVDPLWLLFGLLGVLVILVAWKYALPASVQEAESHEMRYRALGLPEPDSWTLPAIRQRVDALDDQYRRAAVEAEKATRWRGLEDERRQLDEAYAEAEARRDDLVARYGVAPDLGEDSLRLLAENLDRWQAADARLRAATARLDAAGAERRGIATSLREQLATFGGNGDAFDQRPEEQIDNLAERYDARQDAAARRDAARGELTATVLPEIERVASARAGIYARLGVELGDDHAVHALLGQLDAYRDAAAAVDTRRTAVRDAGAALASTPELAERAVADLERGLREAEAAATDLEAVQREIAAILTRIADAKGKREIETALARRDGARLALRKARHDVEASVAGDALLAHLRQETRDAAMPVVFHRARDLFTIITRGRYELQFEEGPPPAFTARDTTTGHTLALDQLSSGTRVQVLMAIRLSFVEHSESGPKLPILLDETLGNSDELRAGAIIDAAIEISRNGRQVFYFTAQGDEVARWQSRLTQLPPEDRPAVTVIDLAEVRRDAGIDRLPLYAATAHEGPDRLPVPAADGLDRAAYGELLRVPGIDPWRSGAGLGNVHLWHLFDDMAQLQRLLEADIATWGQLTALLRAGGMRALTALGVDETAHGRASARARLLEGALATWRIGRTRALSERALEDADVIPSDRLEPVLDVVGEVEGDGGRALACLRATPDVDSETVDAIEAWMREHGYLSGSAALSRDELRARLLASAGPDIERGQLTAQDVDDILNQLPD